MSIDLDTDWFIPMILFIYDIITDDKSKYQKPPGIERANVPVQRTGEKNHWLIRR